LARFSTLIFIFLFLPSYGYGKEEPTVPLAKLPEGYQKKVKIILKSPSIECHVQNTVKTRKFVYEYLLDRLAFTAKVIKALKIADYKITKEPGHVWNINDNLGAKARAILIYRGGNKRIYFATGGFKVPLCPEIKGTGVLVISYKTLGKGRLKCSAHFYLRFSSAVLHQVTKGVARLIKKLVDKKAQQIVQSAQKISEMIHKDPRGVYEKIRKAKGFSKARLGEFKILFVRK